MSADTAAVLIVLLAAPPATLFPLLYGVTRPWWRSLVGRYVFTSALGLGLLIDISLLYNWLGDQYFARDIVRLTVYSLIAAGAWLSLLSFLIERRRNR